MALSIEDLGRIVRLRVELPSPAEARRIRKLAKVSSRDVGGVVGVSGETVLAWERGSRNAHGRNRDRYAEVLRMLDDMTSEPFATTPSTHRGANDD